MWASGADPRILSRQSMENQSRARAQGRQRANDTFSLIRGLKDKSLARETGEAGRIHLREIQVTWGIGHTC